MHLDVEDVLLNAIGTVFGKIILFIVAVWMGCMVGGLGIVAGSMIEHRDWPSVSWGSILACPLLLLSSWALLNIPFLFISLIRFIRSDGDGYLTWGIVIAVEALFGMLGYVRDEMKGWVPMAAAWTTWAMLLIMIGSGIWLVRQHFINCWAREIGMLRVENAQRNAEREAQEQPKSELHS